MNNKVLRRPRSGRSIAGVCVGIAHYFGLDPQMVKLIYVLLSLCTAFSGLLVYIVLWMLIPEE